MSNLFSLKSSSLIASPNPILSIVTLSFNQAKYLRQALESVIMQKTDAVEFIVVDPGSTDGSREIISELRNGIDALILAKDDGPADGLNKGFAYARGHIGYFLNSDDFLMPDAVNSILKNWEAYPDIGLLLGRAWRVREDGSVERELLPTPNDRVTLASGASTIVQQGFSFKMSDFRDIGGFNVNNKSTWDYELLACFAVADVPFKVVPDRFGAFRFYPGGISGGATGISHQQRFDSDYRRIHSEILGKPILGEVMGFLARARYRKMLRHPTHAIHRAQEMIFPSIVRQKYASDMATLDWDS